ncbi:MAG: hypothetical protein Q9M91_02085 [Candidatus Dojkabacteria bacterium]|nr:hypothetical protein [Candidatus Dojkabacteria bacterium]
MKVFSNTEFTNTMINDSLHHYHYGLMLGFVAIVLFKFNKTLSTNFLAFCAATLLDEYSIILYELFGIIPKYLYSTKIDNLIIIFISILTFTLGLTKNRLIKKINSL